MKNYWKAACFLCLISLFSPVLTAQNLQLHYDLRHTVDPAVNPHNFPTLYFEYFKPARDSAQAFIKPGSFLLKTEADLLGSGDNIGKFYLQISQSFRCWKPKIYLSLQYSGGGGITQPAQYSYYIYNNWCAGMEIPFHWLGAWCTSVLDYKYVAYSRPTNDFLYTFYWWKGLAHYKWQFSGDFSCWTENRNHGDEATEGLKGKWFFFFAEPQIWYNLNKTMALGSKINGYYHVNTYANVFQVYPTVAVKVKL
jgi:hypothetical protein